MKGIRYGGITVWLLAAVLLMAMAGIAGAGSAATAVSFEAPKVIADFDANNGMSVSGVETQLVLDMAKGDVNGDGFIDFVSFALKAAGPTLFRNNGDGSFTKLVIPVDSAGMPVPTSVLAFAKGSLTDYDGDGYLDIVALEYNTKQFLFFRNNRGAFFHQATATIAAGEGYAPFDFKMYDIDRDGRSEVVATMLDGRQVQAGDGEPYDGSYIQVRGIAATGGFGGADRKIPLARHGCPAGMTLEATATPPLCRAPLVCPVGETFDAATGMCLSAAVEGSCKAGSVLTAGSCERTPACIAFGGSVQDAYCFVAADIATQTDNLHVADIDGDGLGEIVLTARYWSSVLGYGLPEGSTDSFTYLKLQGDSWVQQAVRYPTLLAQRELAKLADFKTEDMNGDGRKDLIFVTRSAGGGEQAVAVVVNNGGPVESFSVSMGNLDTTERDITSYVAAEVCDVNNDGYNDLLVSKPLAVAAAGGSAASWKQTIDLHYGTGGNTFSVKQNQKGHDFNVLYPPNSNNVLLCDRFAASNNNNIVHFSAYSGPNYNNYSLAVIEYFKGATDSLYPVSYTQTGNGNGAVIFSTGQRCGKTGCSYSFSPGAKIVLTPSAEAGSTFIGWAGCDAVDDNICTVTMTGAKNPQASFIYDAIVNARVKTVISGPPGTYGNLYDTIMAAVRGLTSSGTIMLLQQGVFAEAVDFTWCGGSVVVKGGYDSVFDAVSGSTAIDGGMTVTCGTVVADNIVLR